MTYVRVPMTLNGFYETPGYRWLVDVVGRGNWYFKYLEFGIVFDNDADALMFKLKFIDITV
jgi:hypothetical protein